MKANQTVFQILDLDRTLLDTFKLAHTLKDIIARHDPQLAQGITEQIIKTTEERTSFFLFEYIADRIGYEKLDTYISELNYIAPASELLLPGASERIAFAKSQPGWSVGILTYGAARDQKIKLKLAGLQMERYLITDTPKKGDILASWKLPNGKYKLPIEFGGHTVDVLTLDDDKLIAFNGLPDDVLGQWVTHATIGGMTEMQNLPDNVRSVSNLTESIRYLETKLLNL
ncbi:MAG: hypothetical protein JWO54_734 [Candidatus Saccharibacteria bacterium]|nr:hypothetical protein [Candidatus Saccharibacteria bacterium]MDB5180971.1 hypothetical protein [Candidatus Saccharibacteria bacterium]